MAIPDLDKHFQWIRIGYERYKATIIYTVVKQLKYLLVTHGDTDIKKCPKTIFSQVSDIFHMFVE